ncbi:MAG: outer rane chaperone Skp (OmpH) [Crocinitomicaceae bacterium]|jgi:outer membrane protein|nr:outer rane chaperone Skp (OmpH) [Crocinitomicaceae bacterium]
MKIKFILLTALLAAAVASCGEKTKEKENTTPDVPTIKNGLKIAYYIQDSLKSQFDYYREQDSVTKVKQTKFQKELERRQRSLQEYILKNDERAKSGQLSNYEIQSIQQEAQRREQELYQYQQTQGTKIEEETVEILDVLTKRIEAAGKKYCEKHNIDLLLIHGAGGQINFINSSMDVTKEFIAYLNEHQAEIETDLGKDKK